MSTLQQTNKPIYQQLLLELKQLSLNHPSPSRSNLYQALLNILSDPKKTPIKRLIEETSKLRTDLDSKHYLNLLTHTHACEYLFLIHNYQLKNNKLVPSNGKTYQKFTTKDWKTVLNLISKSPKHLKKAKKELLSKRTQTWVFQRYAGTHLILNHLFKDQKLTLVDAGCSLGAALPTMQNVNVGSYFQKPKAPPEISRFFPLLKKPISTQTIYGFDVEPNNDTWIQACSFYPEEAMLQDRLFKKLIKLRNQTKNAIFIKGNHGNITRMDHVLPKNRIDAVIFNTVLYQLETKARKKALKAALEIIKPNGVIIITDFVHQDQSTHQLKYGSNWFKKGEHQYRTFVTTKSKTGSPNQPLEVFTYPNARCMNFSPGKDFHKIFDGNF